MEQTLGRLTELQLANQQLLRETLGTMGKLSGLVVGIAEGTHERMNGLVAVVERLAGVTDRLEVGMDRLVEVTDRMGVGMDRLETRLAQLAEEQNENLLRMENAVASLASLVEAFIRGSRNGGKKE